jgi:hypothetical protein
VWLTTYRKGPVTLKDLALHSGLSTTTCESALERLAADGRIERLEQDGQPAFRSERFEVPLGDTQGWEIAVLDHYQAMASAICSKLNERAAGTSSGDKVGGSTWSLDVSDGHPLYEEATSTLSRVRRELENLRERIDAYNSAHPPSAPKQRVIFYAGQNLRGE